MHGKWDLGPDPASPVAQYHQIVVGLRYRIATGQVVAGEHLPTLRRAAQLWQVNYHTVRRAYQELETQGLVRRRRGVGTVVAGDGVPAPGKVQSRKTELQAFLARVLFAAKEQHGLSPAELAHLVDGAVSYSDSVPTMRAEAVGSRWVTVVECNRHQSHDLAGQIRARWKVTPREWLLTDPGEPPVGPVIGTFFHYAELTRRWPHRRADMRFPAIYPDPGLRDRLAKALPAQRPVEILLCDREASLAESMGRDVSLLLGPDVRIRSVASDNPETLLDDADPAPVLIAPRVWDQLPDSVRRNPRAVEVRYVFRDVDIEAIAAELGWELHAPERAQHGPHRGSGVG